jgi:hypothetical protein
LKWRGGSDLPFSQRHGTRAPPAPLTTTLWLEDVPAIQAMTMVPPWELAPRLDTGLPLKRLHASRYGQLERAHTQEANTKCEATQRRSKLTGKQATTVAQRPTFSRASKTVVMVVAPLNMLLPPSTHGVDMLYRQLAEIHAIAAVQMVECAHWHQTDSISSLIHARPGWQKPTTEPSATRMASPLVGLPT